MLNCLLVSPSKFEEYNGFMREINWWGVLECAGLYLFLEKHLCTQINVLTEPQRMGQIIFMTFMGFAA